MDDTYGLVNFIGGGRSGQVISSGDFLSLVDSKTILKSLELVREESSGLLPRGCEPGCQDSGR